jgi:7-carboxy-7-deazaguanine synthase
MTVIYPDINARPDARRSGWTLPVSSVFHTIQGEGPFVGRPATFVRLAGCNLGAKGVGRGVGCSFCDADFRLANATHMGVKDIVTRMAMHANDAMDGTRAATAGKLNYHGFSPPIAVITGGEPLLYALHPLFRELAVCYSNIQIETNGSRDSIGQIPHQIEAHGGGGTLVTVVMSPKEVKRGKLHFNTDMYKRADALKLLIDTRSDVYTVPEKEALEFQGNMGVFLSPVAVYLRQPRPGEIANLWPNTWGDEPLLDLDATSRNYAKAAELAVKYGFRFSPQTHLLANLP